MMKCKADGKGKESGGGKAPRGRDDYEDRTRCGCGRGKYADATSCGVCDNGYPDNWLNR